MILRPTLRTNPTYRRNKRARASLSSSRIRAINASSVSLVNAVTSRAFASTLSDFLCASDKMEKRDASDELILDLELSCEERHHNEIKYPLRRSTKRFAAFRSTYNLNNQLKSFFDSPDEIKLPKS